MKKPVYEIDDNGFIIEVYIAVFDDEGNPIEDLAENVISIVPPDGLYHARWTGDEWIEGKTQAEFDEDGFLHSLNPSEEEINNAEHEIKTTILLMEVGIL